MITSRSNEQIKLVRSLVNAKARRESGLHFIEGDKLVLDALASGAQVVSVFGTDESFAQTGASYTQVSQSVMQALCQTQTPQRLCATVRTPSTACPSSYPNGLIVVLDGLQDVGNVGTIIRTADALGAAAVLLGSGSVDPFSPKCVRAAMGSGYHIPIYVGDVAGELAKLNEQGFLCICGHLKGEQSLPNINERTALIVGNEGNGVSDAAAALCYKYCLRQRGRAESLNAAVFAAIMMDRLINR